MNAARKDIGPNAQAEVQTNNCINVWALVESLTHWWKLYELSENS